MEWSIRNSEEKPENFSRGNFRSEGTSSETEEERDRLIALASSVFVEHFRHLGIPLQKEFPKEQFRFLSQEEFDSEFPDMAGASGRHGEGEGISLVEKGTQGERLLTMMHEMTHDVAMKRSELNPHGDIMSSNNGYKIRRRVVNELGGRKLKSYFDALNEAVVEMTAIRLALRHMNDIDAAGISREDIEYALERRHYRDAVMVLEAVISGIAGNDEGAQFDFWKEIECGQYTGETAWARRIDEVFGGGSLRVLDSLIPNPKTDGERKQNENILKYFQMKDANERAVFQSEVY